MFTKAHPPSTHPATTQLSASLDGSVRAFDLVRYRNFRTLTAPSAAQFISLAVDAAGEVVAAGAQEPFSIFVWSLKTGRLLDVLEGHEGPVCGLAFNPTLPMLLSCSWDRTLRTWDVFGGKVGLPCGFVDLYICGFSLPRLARCAAFMCLVLLLLLWTVWYGLARHVATTPPLPTRLLY